MSKTALLLSAALFLCAPNQETDVGFKSGAHWKIAHVHYSDAPKPKAP